MGDAMTLRGAWGRKMKKMDLKLFDSDDKYCWHGDWCRMVCLT